MSKAPDTHTSGSYKAYPAAYITGVAALLLAILAIAVAYCYMLADRPMLHDDLNYMTSSLQWVNTHYPAWLRFPTHMAGSWLSVNGRMGELTTVIFYAILPRWVHVSLIGIMMAGMYLMTWAWVKRLGGGLITAALSIAFLYWGMPWWDNFNLFIMQNNYVWGATLSLAALWLIICMPMRRKVALLWMLPAFAAGQWHEAAGVPLSAGLVIYLWLNRRNIPLSRINLWILAAFILGAAFSMLSPGILRRAAGHNVPDERLWYMLLTSAWMAGIFIISLIVVAFARRDIIRRLYRSPWIIFAVSAILGLAVCAYSGSFGRTGWFAQISAWIAFCGLINAVTGNHSRKRSFCGAIIALTVALPVILTSCSLARYQHSLNAQCRDIITQYRQNPDGVVFCDLSTPSDAPAYLLGRAWGWQGQYDGWNRYLVERTYSGEEMKPLTILPQSLRNLTPADTLLRKKIKTDNRSATITYPAGPDSTYNNEYRSRRPARVYAFRGADGNLYYRQKFYYKGTYGVIDMPADLAPGERFPNINIPMQNDPVEPGNYYALPPDIL